FGKTLSLGLGWRVLGASIDYAVRAPLSNGSRWSHAVSLAYRFGAWDPEAEYEKLLSTEMGYRRQLSSALEDSEVKQWRLAEELRVLHQEIGDLREELEAKTAEAGEQAERARRAQEALKLKELEERHRKAEEELRKIKAAQEVEKERLRQADVQGRFQDEWRAYQNLKLQGAADAALVERLESILSEFKGKGVDLAEANQELQRLERR
ncbi:MAG: hypothetical protein KGL53_13730, partial [Elusimicrobia bacterium]|nr:hypothetical protein [Elusimicrobiota bacterium]